MPNVVAKIGRSSIGDGRNRMSHQTTSPRNRVDRHQHQTTADRQANPFSGDVDTEFVLAGDQSTMIADRETNTVAISDCLQRRFPRVEQTLHEILQKHQVPLVVVDGTRDVWIRDFAPLQIQLRKFVQFRYYPDYLRRNHQKRITKPAVFRSQPFILQRKLSRLILDGGNVVASRRMAILTDKIYRENPTLSREAIRKRLTELLGIERLIVIPKEPYDEIGHADGMVRFLTDDLVVLNDYRVADERYAERLEATLVKAGLGLCRLPYRPELKRYDEIWSAVGNYTNFLRVGNLIVVPQFGRKEDQEVLRLMASWLPTAKLEPLRCERLAREGGVLNCVTWTIQIRSEKK